MWMFFWFYGGFRVSIAALLMVDGGSNGFMVKPPLRFAVLGASAGARAGSEKGVHFKRKSHTRRIQGCFLFGQNPRLGWWFLTLLVLTFYFAFSLLGKTISAIFWRGFKPA